MECCLCATRWTTPAPLCLGELDSRHFAIVSMFLVLLLDEEGEDQTRRLNSAITLVRGKRLGLIRCQLRPKGPYIHCIRQ